MRLITGGRYQGKTAYAGRLAGAEAVVLDGAAAETIETVRSGSLEEFYGRCSGADVLDHCEVLIETLLFLPEARRLCGQEGSDTPGQIDIDRLFSFLWEIFDEIIRRRPDMIFVMAEMGAGVVPIDRHLDCVREQCGRIACKLAEHADSVDRMICGCPVRIRGKVEKNDVEI